MAFITDMALENSSSMDVDSYDFYLYRVGFFIDPLVIAN
jgi:hypothetical protein